MPTQLKDASSNYRHDQELALYYLHSYLAIPVPESNLDWAANARAQIEAVMQQVTHDGVKLRKHGYGSRGRPPRLPD